VHVAAGHVIRQQPDPGTKVVRRGDVHLVVSQGRELFAVPAVTRGSSQHDAIAALTAAHLTAKGTTQLYDATVPKGAVLGTDPAAGTKLPAGGTVKLVLSRGPQPVPVPSFDPKADPKDVEAAITAAGLKVTEQKQNSDTVPEHQVISVSPAPGTPVPPGSPVTVVVSTGPPMVDVPDTTGESVDDATNQLQALGFQVSVRTLFGSDTVRGQRPGSGQARKGSTITLITF
jgi:serine/threonine-protein kinase